MFVFIVQLLARQANTSHRNMCAENSTTLKHLMRNSITAHIKCTAISKDEPAQKMAPVCDTTTPPPPPPPRLFRTNHWNDGRRCYYCHAMNMWDFRNCRNCPAYGEGMRRRITSMTRLVPPLTRTRGTRITMETRVARSEEGGSLVRRVLLTYLDAVGDSGEAAIASFGT